MNRKNTTSIIRLRPRSETVFIAQGQSMLATNRKGFIERQDAGFFVYQTRLLSLYQYRISDSEPLPVALSNVEQHSWLGYYIFYPPDRAQAAIETKEDAPQPSKETIELRLSRFLGEGLHEDVDLTNFTDQPSAFQLDLLVDADFADIIEASTARKQYGKKTQSWIEHGNKWELRFEYHATHDFDVQGEKGNAEFNAAITLSITGAFSHPSYADGRISFHIAIEPHKSWHACIDLIPEIDGIVLQPLYRCRSFFGVENKIDQERHSLLDCATAFDAAPSSGELSDVVQNTLERAKSDLIALRLFDLDPGDEAWIMAAGLPVYIAIYGRDILTASWQAAMISPQMMRGALNVLAQRQGDHTSDWRDEQPGKMLHEARTGPLARLNYIPHQKYYGSATTSGFYPAVLAELWHWTGDKNHVRKFLDPAMKALRWLEQYGDADRDGFYEYQSRSRLGVRNQGWKDSDDAIIYADGGLVSTPIATCEEQAFVYVAKLHLSEVLWWIDEKDLSKKIYREATELKARFNEKFWMDDERFIAMGLDPAKRQITSIGSNAGHCIAAGIVDDSRANAVAERLMRPDLFSGWGIRTLSSLHPRFNPYSYHRGSVWPVEQGTFAIGFVRYGLHSPAERLCRAMFEAAALFDFNRLPELFGGHPRDEDHPFPALYPDACSPQAWSASMVFSLLQSILGLYPYAPLNLLLIDPKMPDWLPEITLSRLQVGNAKCKIRFYRKDDGSGAFEVLDLKGKLHIIRQPSPWSLTATFAERLKDLLTSYI